MKKLFRLGTGLHHGDILQKLQNGLFAVDLVEEFDSYIAACTCGWQSTIRHAPTQLGYSDALGEWADEHVRPLVPSLARRAALGRVPYAVADLLPPLDGLPWERGSMADLTAAIMLEVFARDVYRELHARVRAARTKGASWALVAETLGTTERLARDRFDQSEGA